MTNTTKLYKALLFALEAHKGQTRKGKQTPYIVHPVTAALLVAQVGGSEDAIIAALLHDTVEDTPVTLGQIKSVFGDTIATIVGDLTEKDKTLPWADRKAAALAHIPQMGTESLLVKSADVLHNITDTLLDYKAEGKNMFKKFEVGSSKQLTHYVAVFESLYREYPENPLLSELSDKIAQLKSILSNID